MKFTVVVSVLLFALLPAAVAEDGRSFRLVPLEDKSAISIHSCGEFFFGAKTPNGQFIVAYAVQYPNNIVHNHVLFQKYVRTNIDESRKVPEVNETGSGKVVLWISRKGFEKARSCLPDPPDEQLLPPTPTAGH